MATTIQELIQERGIRHLLHFTKLSNLTTIMNRGLLTRDILMLEGAENACNDEFRLDRTDAVCLSIGFPNYKMFYSLRQNQPGTEWVVLAINPSALWELPCAFCRANAASAGVTAIPLEERQTFEAFRGMFEDFGDIRRDILGITSDLPTNPQAEVLMLRGVPATYIFGIVAFSEFRRDQLRALYPRHSVVFYPRYFNGRSDFAHWR